MAMRSVRRCPGLATSHWDMGTPNSIYRKERKKLVFSFNNKEKSWCLSPIFINSKNWSCNIELDPEISKTVFTLTYLPKAQNK